MQGAKHAMYIMQFIVVFKYETKTSAGRKAALPLVQ
jgi:hypothetical protein